MVRIYRFKQFNVYSNKNGGFIIHNMKKSFERGHTHLNNFHTAKYLIKLAYYERLPEKHLSEYLLESLIRISTSELYISKIKNVLENTKKSKKK